MNNLYNKIYKAINEGIQKALLIDPDQNDVSINYSYHKINNQINVPFKDFVDLGLPSGTLWCDHNLGATCKKSKKSWYGNYYAWGEIENKQIFKAENYQYFIFTKGQLGFDINKYTSEDNKKILDKQDDAATLYYSYLLNYRMPSVLECEELLNNTNKEWVTNYKNINGLNGVIFKSQINDNFIFIPAAGVIDDKIKCDCGDKCYIWLNTLADDHTDTCADILRCYKEKQNVTYIGRTFGISVRGVL